MARVFLAGTARNALAALDRVGAYRIIYELRDDRTVRVAAIRHRGAAYGAGPR